MYRYIIFICPTTLMFVSRLTSSQTKYSLRRTQESVIAHLTVHKRILEKGGDTMFFAKHFKDLKVSMTNKGEELLISVKGDKEKLAHLEKKLGAVKELCCGCCDEEEEGC